LATATIRVLRTMSSSAVPIPVIPVIAVISRSGGQWHRWRK
jgi:hypothetical protein